MKKRILAFLLCAVMVMQPILPVKAAEEVPEEQETKLEFIPAENIKLGENCYGKLAYKNATEGEFPTIGLNRKDAHHFMLSGFGAGPMKIPENGYVLLVCNMEGGGACLEAIHPGTIQMRCYTGRAGWVYNEEPVTTYPLTIEEPVIKTNVGSKYFVGDSLNLTTELTNTKLPQGNIQNLIANNPNINGYFFTYQANVEIMEGEQCVKNENKNYGSALVSSEKLTFVKEGKVKIKITYNPVLMHKWGDDIIGEDEQTKDEIYVPEKIVELKVVDAEKCIHAETEIKNATEVTCTEDGYTGDKYCKNCERIVEYGEKIEALGHDYSKEWAVDKEATCTEAGGKSHHCTRCTAKADETVILISAHKWDMGKVTVQPTCVKEGTRAYTCTACGAIKTEAIPMLEHTPVKVVTKATTSADGKIEEKCSVCGTVLSSTPIYYPKSFSLSTTNYTYNGKEKKPSVKVKDSAGNTISSSNYTVKYSSGRKNIGRYYAKITFKGNYSGSKTLYFTIGPKNPSSVKTSLYGYDDVKLTWSKVSGATGYRIYYKKSDASSYTYLKATKSTSYSKANLADGASYTFKVVAYKSVKGYNCYNAGKTSSITTLKKVSTPKAAKSGSKVKVTWTNIAGESGYQISQSTSKTGTKVVSTYSTTSGKSKTVSAKKGKTYYYKVRVYKKLGSKKIYGPWSTVVKYKL